MSAQPINEPPPRVEPTHATTDLAVLERWASSLPYANPPVVIASLAQEAARMNAAALKPALRLKLLEVHARGYDRLGTALVRGTSARERWRAVSMSARILAMRLAAGYGQVAKDLDGARSWLSGSRQLATAARREAVFLTHALLHGYGEYAVPDPRLWVQLARVQRLATERRFADTRGSGDWTRTEFRASVTHLYKRALLTGLADPHRLGRGEIWRAYDLLGEHADAAVLARHDDVPDTRGVFLVAPGAARHGVCLASVDAATIPADAVALDARPVSRALGAMLQAVEAGTPGSAAESRARRETISLLRRVVAMLDSLRQRGGERKRASSAVHVAVGIGAIHAAMGVRRADTPRATFEVPAAARKPSAARTLLQAIEPEGVDNDAIDMIDPHSGATVSVREPGGPRGGSRTRERAADTGGTAPGTARDLDTWQVADSGPRGIGIVRESPPSAPVGVGEPVAVRAGDTPWVVGVIRWMMVDASKGHRAGVEMLSQSATPVELRAMDAGSGAVSRAGLVLGGARADGGGLMVALPGSYGEGRVFHVQGFDEAPARRVRATSLLDTTAVCEVIVFEFIGNAPRRAAPGAGTA